MVKGEDAVWRKKNKVKRKKLNAKESVSARVAAIIASKKRRQSGKRRQCQGMCFSLPTLEDPFNDRHGKEDFQKKETKKKKPLQAVVKGKSTASEKGTDGRSKTKVDHLEQKNDMFTGLRNEQKKSHESVHHANGRQGTSYDNLDCPSKFLILCLNAIENALHHDGNGQEEKPLFVNSWGVEFWKCYSSGNDILETSGSSSTVEQIAWIVSAAADNIARKEKEGLSFTSPFLLFLVPNQEEAAKVRSVCKPLKALGVHTVSLHPGAALDHQINGLKSCEPEFLVSTPERLLELVYLKAIDITRISLLVVDGLESLCKGGHLGAVNSIRQSIFGKPQTVVFNGCSSYASVPAVQNLLAGSINRLSLNDSVSSQSACVIQFINVCASEEEKLLKGIQVLDGAYGSQLSSEPLKAVYIVGKDSKFQKLVSTLNLKGYSISTGSRYIASEVKKSVDGEGKKRGEVSVIGKDEIGSAELGEYEVVIIPDFVISVESYVEIVTRMARHSVNGAIHSLFTKDEAAAHAGDLIEILEECGQAVPEVVRKLSVR